MADCTTENKTASCILRFSSSHSSVFVVFYFVRIFFCWQGERIGKIGINVCRRWNGTQVKTPTNVNLNCQIDQMFVDFRKEIETTSNTNKQNPKQIHSFGSHANDAKIITDTIQSYSRQRKYMAVDAFPRITWCVSVCVISIGSIQCMRKRRGIRIAGQKIA